MEPVVTSSYTATPGKAKPARHSVLHDMVVGKDNIGFFENEIVEVADDEETARMGHSGEDPEDPPRLRLSSNNDSEPGGQGDNGDRRRKGGG